MATVRGIERRRFWFRFFLEIMRKYKKTSQVDGRISFRNKISSNSLVLKWITWWKMEQELVIIIIIRSNSRHSLASIVLMWALFIFPSCNWFLLWCNRTCPEWLPLEQCKFASVGDVNHRFLLRRQYFPCVPTIETQCCNIWEPFFNSCNMINSQHVEHYYINVVETHPIFIL
jgi:hypothetical protein